MKRSGSAGKKSGLPSAKASDAAERSPAVYFANLKADMFLQRQLHVIKRAESALVHRISIEQKVLFRRFQAKLRRSKIARARLWGDKDTERELRTRDLHVLNTNCGQERDDFDFLKKLERRPCITDDETQVKARPRTTDGRATEVTDKDMEELIQAVMKEQVPPPTDKTLQSLSTLGQLLEEAQLISTEQETDVPAREASRKQKQSFVRPATTDLGVRPGRRDAASRQMKPTSSLSPASARKHSDRSPTSRKSPSPPRHGKSRTGKPSASPKQKKKPRPLTSPAVAPSHDRRSRKGEQTTPSPRMPTSPGRRKSVQFLSTLVSSTSRRPSHQASMFEEQEKVDLVAMRLEEARANDLTPKVDAFLKSLDECERRSRERSRERMYQGDEFTPEDGQVDLDRGDVEEAEEELKGDRKFDYYATKMAILTAGVKREPLPSIPGTPEEVNMRLVGNQAIKSLTMPRLCLQFDDVSDDDGDNLTDNDHQVQLDFEVSPITDGGQADDS